MGKIVPHLWFDQNAKEAVEFYTQLFENSKIENVYELEHTPSGADTVSYEFELAGQSFQAINGGPLFDFNPSISFMVAVATKEEAKSLWTNLVAGGKELMPLKKYAFNEYYGWVQDKYGLSWQLIYFPDKDYQQKITPSFLFSNKVTGKTEAAINFYTDIFQGGSIDEINRYEAGAVEHPKAEVAFSTFHIMETQFHAMDNNNQVDFSFNEALSFMVLCTTQAEIDYYWEKLSAVPEAEECGWLKDKYGVSWQIVPRNMNKLLKRGTKEQNERMLHSFLKMKKINLEALELAGRS